MTIQNNLTQIDDRDWNDRDWKKWRTPLTIAIVSWILSQLILYDLGVGLLYQILYCGGYAFVLLAGSRNFGFVFIYRVMVPLLFGVLMVWIYRESYQITMLSEFLSASRTNIQYLTWLFDILATLYAICTAFLLWKGLTDHDTLRKMLSDEANYIERLVGYIHYFDLRKSANVNFARGMLEKLHKYIENIVVGDEIKVSHENTNLLRDTVSIVASVDAKDDHNDKIALAETMKSLSDLAMARSKRLSQMEITMSPYLLIALGVMSFTVIYPFFTEAPSENDYVREACILILGTLLSFLLVTLLDISRPFNGFWKIKTDSFENVKALIEDEIKILSIQENEDDK